MLKRAVRRGLRRLGWDLRRIGDFTNPTLSDFLRVQSIDLVIDIGANEGQFAAALRNDGYSGEILSFEPLAAAFAKLEAAAARDRRWIARRLALGDRNGTAELIVTEKTVFSSLKLQADAIAVLDRGSRIVGTEPIEMTTLECVLGGIDDGRRIFLKVDTQGYEQHVLAGAGDALARIQAVQLELPIVHLYQEVWSLTGGDRPHAIRRLRDRPAPPGRLFAGHRSVGGVDCVFRRADRVPHPPAILGIR